MTTFKLIEQTSKLFKTGLVSFYNIDVIHTDTEISTTDNTLSWFLLQTNYPIVDNSALGRPFNLANLTPSDFNIVTKTKLTHFLNDFSAPAGWTEKEEIVNQIKYISEKFKSFESDVFYIISPSFFEIEDDRTDIFGHAYVYYYLIVSINTHGQMLVCNMCLD